MTHKEIAIETLESIAHWMKTSSFDYDLKPGLEFDHPCLKV